MKKHLLLVLPLFITNIAVAGNYSTILGVEVYGDGNFNNQSPYSITNGYNNTLTDIDPGGETRSSESSMVTGSGNYFGTGEWNSAFGNNNTVTGGIWTNGANVFGNGNTTNTAHSNTIGNKNNVTGTGNITMGNNSYVSGNNSISLGSNNTASNSGIAIGSGSTATRGDEVNFGDRQLTGVKAGEADSDAVNVKQINDKAQTVVDDANHYTDNAFEDAKSVSNSYTDQKIYDLLNDSTIDFSKDNAYATGRINQLNKKLEKIQKQVNAGISSAIASASVPHKLGKQISFGMGVGTYKNELAYAFGIKWGVTKRIALGSSIAFNTQQDTSLSLSIAYGF